MLSVFEGPSGLSDRSGSDTWEWANRTILDKEEAPRHRSRSEGVGNAQTA